VIDGANGHQQYQASELDIEDGTKVFFDDVKTHEMGVMTLGGIPLVSS
jgi:hypothetical protein